ncbi:DNA repair protein RecO [Spiroplasma endosymbiont of Amphibalanus improvisus]|uniref:DNA repair protein RecO n=1 Tax=Spiroplasma endosymbiont of Amphibalanus improvisus TaxID=3066327 RepID=UPI00313B90D8
MTTFIDAIVISNYDYDDYAQVITVFSKQKGKLSFYANGVRKLNSKNKYSVGLFNLSEFELFLSPHKDKLSKLKTGTLITENIQISTNYDSYIWVSLITDLINKNFDTHQKYPTIFRLLKDFLEYIIIFLKNDNKTVTIALFTVWKLFKYCGFDFHNKSCVRCSKENPIATFSIKDKGFICNFCLENDDYIFSINILKIMNLWNCVPFFEKIKYIHITNKDLLILKKIILNILDQELGYMSAALYKLSNYDFKKF